MSEVPLDEAPRAVADAAHDAARGRVVYLTEHGERLAAIVPAEVAAEMESMSPEAFRELLEDFADAEAVRQALAEGGEPIPWEQVKAEAEAEIELEAELYVSRDLQDHCAATCAQVYLAFADPQTGKRVNASM